MEEKILDVGRFLVVRVHCEDEWSPFRIKKCDSVRVVVYGRNHEFLLLNIKRPGYKNRNYELPGGQIEPGESPVNAAIRELYEETGLTVNTLDFVCKLPLLPSLLDENVHVYSVKADLNNFELPRSATFEGIKGFQSFVLNDISLLIKKNEISIVDVFAINQSFAL